MYGLTSVKEIQREFFKQLNPKLSSKGLVITGKIMKTIVEVWSGADISDNEFELFINTDDYLLIFDDIERCNIQLSDLLGYINNYVEHKKNKAVIIGYEEEITNKDDTYKRIKEKLIGKTFG